MKKIIFILIMMLFMTTNSFANETKKYNIYNPIKIENISEAYVNLPANVIWRQINENETNDFINIRVSDEYYMYMLNHISYEINDNKIIFNTDLVDRDVFDYYSEIPINICIYSKDRLNIKTNNKNLLILQKNNQVLTNEN